MSTLPELFEAIPLKFAYSPDSSSSEQLPDRANLTTSLRPDLLTNLPSDWGRPEPIIDSATIALLLEQVIPNSSTPALQAAAVQASSNQIDRSSIAQTVSDSEVLTLNSRLPDLSLGSDRPTVVSDPALLTGLGNQVGATLNPTNLITFSNLAFSGNEGASGTFQVRLNLAQSPTSDITVTFAPGSFLVVDSDNNLTNGTQNTLTFTAQNWNQSRSVWFMAEVDGVATDRAVGNTIAYTVGGAAPSTGTYDLGVVKNTYSPDLTRFNLDLDFRNDYTGFWTTERRAIAQKAANDWASRIANEWTGLQLNNSLSKIGNDGNYTTSTYATKRYVDDLVVFVNTINTGGTAGGFGSPEYDMGGWYGSPDLMPRVGQIAIDPAVGDRYLYNAVLHELGHTLGLVGLNWAGYLQQDLTTPQTAVFKGAYSTAANGGRYIPLQSQDGPNPVTGTYDYWHPSRTIQSVMSYGWLYSVTAPTAIDYALLADSGYRVYGVNAPTPAMTTPATTPIVAAAVAA